MIIKRMLREGFCFAVVQSFSYLTQAKIYTNQEWEILALSTDHKDLENFLLNNHPHLPNRHRNPEGIISREMNLDEIREFKSLEQEYFTKVIDTEYGQVWELKNKSLKKMYDEN